MYGHISCKPLDKFQTVFLLRLRFGAIGAVDQFRQASAQKRQGDQSAIDVQEYQDDLAGSAENPSAAFDISWAAEVIRQTTPA